MQIVKAVSSFTYGLLYLVAGIKQYRSAEKKRNPLLIIIGSIFVLDGAIYDFFPNRLDYLIEIVGCAMICIGTYLNGKDSDNIHLSHHLIRAVISVAIVLLYIFF